MGCRVLVVDDCQVTRVMFHDMLENLGHAVVGEAGTAATGLASYKEVRPDLVLLDFSLPDEDGLSLLKNIRDLDPKAKVVLISGMEKKEIHEQAIALHAFAVLVKPIRYQELGAVLDKALASPQNTL